MTGTAVAFKRAFGPRIAALDVIAAESSEPLTWIEICALYPDEWVCLVEMDHIHPNGLEFVPRASSATAGRYASRSIRRARGGRTMT